MGITDDRHKVVFHTLRHTFASWLAQKGVPLHTLAGLMGQKTFIMAQRYAHLSPEGLKAATMLIDDLVCTLTKTLLGINFFVVTI